MKMAITGGAGFIGANFIYYILNNYPEHVVVCIDALTYAGNMETLESALAKRRFVFHRADIADRMAI